MDAVAVLVRPHWLVWAIALLVAASAARAVYLCTCLNVGPSGPMPDMYEPTWALPGRRAHDEPFSRSTRSPVKSRDPRPMPFPILA